MAYGQGAAFGRYLSVSWVTLVDMVVERSLQDCH